VDLNRPDVVAEVTEQFLRYEAALVTNDVALLGELFWANPATVRYGVTENLYGSDAIARFRSQRSPVGLDRVLLRTVITTFGTDAASVCAEFQRKGSSRRGRQTQTWVRTDDGWRIVAAHVSLIEPPAAVGGGAGG
jgi:hypothetical protein